MNMDAPAIVRPRPSGHDEGATQNARCGHPRGGRADLADQLRRAL